MKLNVKAMAITAGLIGVGVMLMTGLANLIWPSYAYGQTFLEIMASVYPGYNAAASFGEVIVGSLYGLVDGAVCGAVFAWLYNRFVGAA